MSNTNIIFKEQTVEEQRVDMRKWTKDEIDMYDKQAQMMFVLNHTMPRTEEYNALLKELLGNRIGEGSMIAPPIAGAAIDQLAIGRNVYINSGSLLMARGGIAIEDDVLIAANVQLISNNHDPYDRAVLTCKPVLIKKGAWIGAGASIMPGVTVGRYAIVGAASVVTHDVPDYAVVVGSPARVIKTLAEDKFRA